MTHDKDPIDPTVNNRRLVTKSWARRLVVKALAIAATATLMSSSHVLAQPAANLPIVGYLHTQTEEAAAAIAEALIEGLAELGWTDGENVHFEFRYAGGDAAQVAPLANELVALAPAAIVAIPAVTDELLAATTTIPIIIGYGGNDFVREERTRPGTNVTGPIIDNSIGDAEFFQLAQELVPDADVVGFLLNANGADGGAEAREEVTAAAEAQGLSVVFAAGGGRYDPDGAAAGIRELAAQGADVVTYDSLYIYLAAAITAEAQAARLPVIHQFAVAVEDGGLISYGFDLEGQVHRAASFVDRVLRGATVAELPWETFGDAYFMAINPAAAAEIGFTFPASIRERADLVIE